MSNSIQRPSLAVWLHPKNWLLLIALAKLAVISYLPLAMQRHIGQALGMLVYWLVPKRRQVALLNLRHCFPELSAAQLIKTNKQCHQQLGITLTEMGIAWFRDFRRYQSRVTIDGLEHFTAAQSNEKGVILLSGHWLCMELAIGFLHQHGEVAPVYRPHEQPILNYMYQRNRQWACGETIDRNDFRKMVRHIKKGNTLWYAPDQNFRNNMVFAPFFNQPAATLTATTTLKKMSGATVLGFSFYRTQSGWALKIEPLTHISGENELTDASEYNAFLERNIRQQPAQYLWTHKRFKTQPDGVSLYESHAKKG